jgi:hypothetical protein
MRLGLAIATCIAATIAGGAAAAPAMEPLVVVQSLPMSGPQGGNGTRVMHGSRAYVSRINAEGGIGGRAIELVTLDDEGDATRHAANLRKGVAQRHAVAILGCVGDNLCQVSAAAARELRVPLVGALSGSDALTRANNPWVFRIRAGYAAESAALGAQKKACNAAESPSSPMRRLRPSSRLRCARPWKPRASRWRPSRCRPVPTLRVRSRRSPKAASTPRS